MATPAVLVPTLAEAVCDALGIDITLTRSVTITLSGPGEVVDVSVDMFTTRDALEGILDVVEKNYRLVPVDA